MCFFVAGGQEAPACSAAPTPALAGSQRMEQGRHFRLFSDTGSAWKGDSENRPTEAMLRKCLSPAPSRGSRQGSFSCDADSGLGLVGGGGGFFLAGGKAFWELEGTRVKGDTALPGASLKALDLCCPCPGSGSSNSHFRPGNPKLCPPSKAANPGTRGDPASSKAFYHSVAVEERGVALLTLASLETQLFQNRVTGCV